MKYLKVILLSLTLVSVFAISGTKAMTASPRSSHTTPITLTTFISDACNGLKTVSTTASCTSTKSPLTSIVQTVVVLMSYVIGAIAIIMIIVAGFKYVTSGGDSNAVSSAHKTLIYALVGLAVAVLAQLLIHYTIGEAQNVESSYLLHGSANLNWYT